MMQRYEWKIIQTGMLALKPNRQLVPVLEHRPTVVLLWPEGERPAPQNTLLTDPFFTDRGFDEAISQLQTLGIGFGSVGYIFVSHYHYDHMPRLPAHAPQYTFKLLVPGENEHFPDVQAVALPGHDPLLRALTFTAATGERVWLVGDAILNEEWLRAWEYYWPNGYERDEIIQTWRSTAAVLADADVILPGHGAPIQITPELLRDLAVGFERAEYADQCPEVIETLHKRLKHIGA